MRFSNFVCFEAIVSKLVSTDRDGVITELIEALAKAGKLDGGDYKKIAKAVIKRENEASTGMGKAVALPHVKSLSVKNTVATVGISATGVDFSSLDKQPACLVILVISPVNDPDKHLQVMEYVFRHLQNEKFRKFLRQSKTADQIEDILREADEDAFL